MGSMGCLGCGHRVASCDGGQPWSSDRNRRVRTRMHGGVGAPADPQGSVGATRFAGLQTELLLNEPHQALFDLGMARNGCPASGDGIGVDVVSLAVALQVTATLDQRADEVATLHTSTPSSRVCAPTCAGSDSVSSIIR